MFNYKENCLPIPKKSRWIIQGSTGDSLNTTEIKNFIYETERLQTV